jgi:hypothetical protein
VKHPVYIYIPENITVCIFSGAFGNVLKNEKSIFSPSQTQCRWEKITKGITILASSVNKSWLL